MKHYEYNAHAQERDFDRFTFNHVITISAGICSFFFFFPVNMTLKPNSKYIKWSFSIGNFKRYVTFKSDYLELLLSVDLYSSR